MKQTFTRYVIQREDGYDKCRCNQTVLRKKYIMEYNEKDFPKRIYHILWHGGLEMLYRLNPDKLKVNVNASGMPYAHVMMTDCKRGEEWKLADYQKEIENIQSGKIRFGYSSLGKDYIAKLINDGHEGAATYILDEEKAKTISKETWEHKSPTGEAYDVVSYWDDCDRKVINPQPLVYSDARKLCEKYLSTRPSGSLYHYTVEVHRTN